MESIRDILTTPWLFLPIGYLFTILIETPILCACLSREHSPLRRFQAGLWLTACTYPIVVLVLPYWIEHYTLYLLAAETFAPLAECALFWAAFTPRQRPWCDLLVIVVANLASFVIGMGVQFLLFGIDS